MFWHENVLKLCNAIEQSFAIVKQLYRNLLLLVPESRVSLHPLQTHMFIHLVYVKLHIHVLSLPASIASPWAYSCFKVKSYLTARGMHNINITKYVGKQLDKVFKWKKGETR